MAVVKRGYVLGNGRLYKGGAEVWRSHIQVDTMRRLYLKSDPRVPDEKYPLVRKESAPEVLRNPDFKMAVCAIRIQGVMTDKGMYAFPEGSRCAAIINFTNREVKLVTVEASPELQELGYTRMPLIVQSAKEAKASIYENFTPPAEPETTETAHQDDCPF